MSFLETIERTRTFLERNRRVSLNALRREFSLDENTLDEVVEELTDIQGVAVKEGRALVWIREGMADGAKSPASSPEPERSPLDYTPRHLAEKILSSRSALEGELKQVTVLFADVKGSMDLAEQVGAEGWHRLLDRFFAVLTKGVHRFEGTVNQYTGDGIMALFGAPIAHEDHAQRACHAALQLRQDLERLASEVEREQGLPFSTRIGMHSGEVVVGKIGDDLRMDYTAQGPTVGLAARLEALAAPGTIYLSNATAALVGGYFELEDLGKFPIKGVKDKVHVHQLTAAGTLRTKFDVSRARGLTGFVGRDADLQTLETALEQSLAGNAQVVGVVAEAGVGKSRLCYEFLERCRGRGMQVNEGRAVAHGRNIPLLPMLQVFRSYHGIEEHDDPQTVRDKVARPLQLMGDEFRAALPLLFDFFGAPDPEQPAPDIAPAERQRQLFGVLRSVVQQNEAPTVSMVEDLHWLDPASEAFLEHWVESAPGGTGLLIVNFRPEYHADWMAKSWYRQLPLAPLGPEAVQGLLDELLGTHPSVKGLGQRVHERTGGNPFFTEEVLQMLIESDRLEGVRGAYRLVVSVKTIEVPATVQSLLAARIDRLKEREKHVLQAAAVLGREFTEPILRAVVGLPQSNLTDELADALSNLKASEFVYEQSTFPVAEYIFKHALTQEVALGSQLQDRRQGLHAAAARTLEAAWSDRLDEKAPVIAHHWDEAGDAWLAAQWHHRAAEWARKGDPFSSLRHWQRAWELSADLTETTEVAALRLSVCLDILDALWRVGSSEDYVADLIAKGKRLAEGSGDRRASVRLLAGQAARQNAFEGGDMRRYYSFAQEAATFDEPSLDVDTRAFVQLLLSLGAHYSGRLVEALAATESLKTLSDGDPHVGFASFGFSGMNCGSLFAALTKGLLGRHEEAWQELLGAIGFAREHNLTETLGWCLGCASNLAWISGGAPRGAPNPRSAALEAVEIADRLETPQSLVLSRINLAVAIGGSGDHAACIEAAREAIAIKNEYGVSNEWSVWPFTCLSHALREQGDASGAVEAGAKAVERAESIGQRAWGIDTLIAHALAVLAADGLAAAEQAEALLARADKWLLDTGARAFQPMILEARAELARVKGQNEDRERLRRDALQLFQEMGALGHAQRLAGELGAGSPK